MENPKSITGVQVAPEKSCCVLVPDKVATKEPFNLKIIWQASVVTKKIVCPSIGRAVIQNCVSIAHFDSYITYFQFKKWILSVFLTDTF